VCSQEGRLGLFNPNEFLFRPLIKLLTTNNSHLRCEAKLGYEGKKIEMNNYMLVGDVILQSSLDQLFLDTVNENINTQM